MRQIAAGSCVLALAAIACSAPMPMNFFGGSQAFNFNLAAPNLPTGIVATRTGANVYAQTGANAVQLVTSADVYEDRGTGTGGGHWTWGAFTNDHANANDFVTSWTTSTGNDIRTATGTVGPDGSINGTFVYDVGPDTAARHIFSGSTATTKAIQASVWVKQTGIAAPTFSQGFLDTPGMLATATFPANQEFGVDITADVGGEITAVAFYKPAGEVPNTHTINIWNVGTSSLIQAVATSGETSSGWQVQTLATPIAISSSTHYRVSMTFANGQQYAYENATPTYPVTVGHITNNGTVYNLTAGSYPGSSGGTQLPLTDIVFQSTSTIEGDPSVAGAISPRPDDGNPGLLTSASSWTRVSTTYVPGASTTGTFELYPAGTTVVAGSPPTLSFTIGATGGYQVWGAQLGVGIFEGDPPLVMGSTSSLTLAITDATLLNQLPNPSTGKLHLVGDFVVDGTDTQFGLASPAVALFSMDTPTGKYAVYAGNQTVISATVRGVTSGTSGLTANVGTLLTNSDFRWELYYDPAVPTARLQAWVNGLLDLANGSASVGSISGSVDHPTKVAIGSETDGSLISMRRNTYLARADLVGRSDPDRVEFVVFGDSITADYSGVHSAAGKHVYTFSEAKTRNGIGAFAFPGETCVQQLDRWNGVGHLAPAVQRGKSYVTAFSILCGTNDISTGSDGPTTATHIQNLVNDINTNNPTATIYLFQLTPRGGVSGETGAEDTAVAYVNAAIAGTANTITGSNLVRVPAWIGLSDGSATPHLASWTDSGDGLHENEAGSIYYGQVFRAELQANGQLGGGSAPTCTSFSPSHGAIGSTVTITGTNLTPINAGSVNGTALTSLVPGTSTTATITVPTGATTGSIVVSTPLGNATCPGTFTVP